jgi:hypothetical protein
MVGKSFKQLIKKRLPTGVLLEDGYKLLKPIWEDGVFHREQKHIRKEDFEDTIKQLKEMGYE